MRAFRTTNKHFAAVPGQTRQTRGEAGNEPKGKRLVLWQTHKTLRQLRRHTRLSSCTPTLWRDTEGSGKRQKDAGGPPVHIRQPEKCGSKPRPLFIRQCLVMPRGTHTHTHTQPRSHAGRPCMRSQHSAKAKPPSAAKHLRRFPALGGVRPPASLNVAMRGAMLLCGSTSLHQHQTNPEAASVNVSSINASQTAPSAGAKAVRTLCHSRAPAALERGRALSNATLSGEAVQACPTPCLTAYAKPQNTFCALSCSAAQHTRTHLHT
jgi:hypothetical protein